MIRYIVASAGTGLLFTVFVMAGPFLLLASALPGGPTVKGLSFGLMAWFFRVAMGVAGQWVAFKIPPAVLVYMLATGLIEMLVLGVMYGRALSGTVYHD